MIMSGKLWQGRQTGTLDAVTEALNRSIRFDQRLYPYDIRGSIAHATMLSRQGIITPVEAEAIVSGLKAILGELESGALSIDLTAEDIHSFVEAELTRRIGEAGKKLHTGRSRNDQVTTDFRLFLQDEIQALIGLLQGLQSALKEQADAHAETIMPGYTHLQRAQPVTFGRHLMAYHAMMERDIARLRDAEIRLMQCPLGAGALAGTTFPVNRSAVAESLGFRGVMENTLDAVSDRDYVLEFLSAASIVMTHLSRLCEEIILWCSQEFQFVTLADAYTTGSSMMPQKKNPDVAELVRGKTGRVYGHLMGMLTVMKGLPLAYNKDMQEDKEAVFDTLDTLKLSLQALTPMIATMQAHPKRMLQAAHGGFINATDLADYLVRKGVAFRDAYALVGRAVQYAVEQGFRLEEIPLETYREFSPQFGDDLYAAIDLHAAVKARGLLPG
jgi:argininosuccinate lyase